MYLFCFSLTEDISLCFKGKSANFKNEVLCVSIFLLLGNVKVLHRSEKNSFEIILHVAT